MSNPEPRVRTSEEADRAMECIRLAISMDGSRGASASEIVNSATALLAFVLAEPQPSARQWINDLLDQAGVK